MWVTEMEYEIESDLSVFHRIDDMDTLGSRRWARLVPNLVYYSGAVQGYHRLVAQRQGSGHTTPAPSAIDGLGAGGGVGVRVAADGTPLLAGPPSPLDGTEVGSSPAELRFSDIGDMFSFG